MNQSRIFEFSIHFQRTLLSRILQDEDFKKKSLRYLSVDIFDSDAFQWVVRKIIKGFSTIPIIVSELKVDKNKGILKEDIIHAIGEELKLFIRKVDFDDAQYGLDRLKEFVIRQKIESGLVDIATEIKDSKGSIESVKNKMGKLISIGLDDDTIKTINIITDKNERFKEREEKVKHGDIVFIPTGIKELDEDIKGPTYGDVWSFFGDTNIGKSVLAVNIGGYAMLSGFKVHHFVVEDKLSLTSQRYDSYFSKTKYDRFTYCDYTDEEKERVDKIFKLLEEKRKNHIFLTKIEEGCSMFEIEEEFNRVIKSENFYPDLIIIDSPYNMTAAARQENNRLNCSRVYQEIRKFIRKQRCAMILMDQSKQEMKGKKADTDASSESYDKARIADGFITMNQTRMQRKEGIVELWIAKMKDRKKHISYLLRPQMDIIRFDSINNGGKNG